MLLKKMLRELWTNKVQFLSIFIISFLGVFVYTGLTSIGRGMESSSQKYYEETNLADAYCYGVGFSDEAITQLEKSEYIKKATRRLSFDTSYETETSVTLQVNFIDSDEISGFHVVEGEAFRKDSQGIYVDQLFAKEHNIKLGDTINYTYGDYKMSSKVAALIMQPDYLYAIQDENQMLPNHQAYGYAFLSSTAYPFAEIEYTQLLLKTTTENKDIIQREVEKSVESNTILTVLKKDFPSYAMFKNEILQMSAVGMIFPIVFLLIAALTTLTTMTRITTNQRIQIGTLKALGFSNARIIRHYMSYGLFINVISSLLGIVLGPTVLPATVFQFQKEFYSMPNWEGQADVTIYLVVGISIVLSSLSCYVACRSQLDVVVARVLRPKPIKAGKENFLQNTKLWKKTSFSIQWNMRDIGRNKIRSFVTILGVVGCMMLILCGIGMQDTTNNLTEVMYGKLHKYNTKLVLSKTDESKADVNNENEDNFDAQKADERKMEEDAQYIYEGMVEVKNKDSNASVSITVVSDGNYLAIQNLKGQEIDYPEHGIAISQKTAKKLDLKVGDEVEWKQYGEDIWKSSEIAVITKNPLGQGFYMSKEVYENAGYTFVPTSFLTLKSADNFDTNHYESIQTKSDLIVSIESMLEMMQAIIAVMIFAAIILGVVVLYNLGVMSFHEKTRELATLKVLGFQYKKLAVLLRQQNSWLTMTGILIGIPSGYLLLAKMMSFMGDSMDMSPQINITSYLFSALGIFVLSTLVNVMLSKKLKRIDMVSALKSVE